MLDNTLIVFSSYRSSVDDNNHVPFFVYWKGKISPVVSDALVSPVDLIASLGKLVGVSVPEGLDSHEYVNAFMGPFKAGFYQTFAALFGPSLGSFRKSILCQVTPNRKSLNSVPLPNRLSFFK